MCSALWSAASFTIWFTHFGLSVDSIAQKKGRSTFRLVSKSGKYFKTSVSSFTWAIMYFSPSSGHLGMWIYTTSVWRKNLFSLLSIYCKNLTVVLLSSGKNIYTDKSKNKMIIITYFSKSCTCRGLPYSWIWASIDLGLLSSRRECHLSSLQLPQPLSWCWI